MQALYCKRFDVKSSAFWLRLSLGGMLFYAGAVKIGEPQAFAELVENYQILPLGLVNAVAVALPWLECFLGIFLVCGIWLPGAVLLSNLLLMFFLGALGFNLLRGLDVHCGCFHTGTEGEPRMWFYLLRDGVFVLMSALLLCRVFFPAGGKASRLRRSRA